MSFHHVTVLPHELVDAIDPSSGTYYVDVTAGGGGHSALLLSRYPNARLLSLDRDPRAVAATRERLATFGDRSIVVNACFDELSDVLAELQFGREVAGAFRVDGVMGDLGVSSPQMDVAERGFAFMHEGPLDMRMGGDGPTAAEWLLSVTDEELANALSRYGDVPGPMRYARAIRMDLAAGKIRTTRDLAGLCERLRDRKAARQHNPATLVFQAIRIAVNDELGQLERLLKQLPDVLHHGGMAAFISFHSLEDRLVKHTFAAWTTPPPVPRELPIRDVLGRTPFVKAGKAVEPSDSEQHENPRSRSARMRAVRRNAPERA